MVKNSDATDTGIVLNTDAELVDKVLLELDGLMQADHVNLDALFDAVHAVASYDVAPLPVDSAASYVTVGAPPVDVFDHGGFGVSPIDGIDQLAYGTDDGNNGNY